MTFAYGETVQVLTASPLLDPYSDENDGEDWENATSRDVDHVGVAAGGSSEPTEDARNAVVSDFDLFFPSGDPVTAQDRVIVRGLTCEISGRPFDWVSPFSGWAPGLLVRAKIVEG